MKPFEIALKEWGIKSISGIIHNPDVIKYFKEIGHSWVKDDETAWCAAFVSWCIEKAQRGKPRMLGARKFLLWGVPTTAPELGDLVILWRINRTGPYGHVGFYVRETKDLIYILGGNQSNAVNITAFPKTQLLEYRKIPV